jgi:hypothetical protein
VLIWLKNCEARAAPLRMSAIAVTALLAQRRLEPVDRGRRAEDAAQP